MIDLLKMSALFHSGLNKFTRVLSNMRNDRKHECTEFVVTSHAFNMATCALLFVCALHIATSLFFLIVFHTIKYATRTSFNKIKSVCSVFECFHVIFFLEAVPCAPFCQMVIDDCHPMVHFPHVLSSQLFVIVFICIIIILVITSSDWSISEHHALHHVLPIRRAL